MRIRRKHWRRKGIKTIKRKKAMPVGRRRRRGGGEREKRSQKGRMDQRERYIRIFTC